MLKVGGVLGCKMIALADILEEGSEDGDLLWVLSGADGDAFVMVMTPLTDFVFLDVVKDIVF